MYDGLGRRIKTKFTPYKNGDPEKAREITLTSLYDPEVEFLELGVVVQVGEKQPRTLWKIYGASNNGIYGENNGHCGLEAVIEGDTGFVHRVINNVQGDIIATIDNNNKLIWEKESLYSYGPIGIPPLTKIETAQNPGELASAIVASSIWKGRKIDPTGFINFGARHYDPLTGRFLSCDPLGHVATPDLYSYADGDPVNNIDPDGRFFSEAYETTKETISQVTESVRGAEAVLVPPFMAVGGYLACEAAAAGAGFVIDDFGGAAVVAGCSHSACLAAAGAAGHSANMYYRGSPICPCF